jgi:hypothetical protein
MDPSISVVVVNLNGRNLLAECLDGLVAQEYPSDLVEIVMVDNGSTDDSVSFVREKYPRVQVVEAGRNLGFAGGNNLGARIATGYYLALINNDAVAGSHWLHSMVEALEDRPKVVCAASRILDEQGETIDFVGPAMNLYGRAFHIDEGLPAESGSYEEPRELLAPCGGAMMVERDVFWEIGGFDEDYLAYFEDLDLGWRLWLYGYKVLFVPGAVVYHKKHQTGSGFPVEQRYVLSEVNALRTIIKNYEEENLWRVLPFGLFMGVKRALCQAGLSRERYQIGHRVANDAQAGVIEPEPQMTRVATSYLVAIDQIAGEMPRLMQKRQRIQEARVRSDEAIFTRFPLRPDNWIFPWRQYHVVQDQLVEELRVPETLQPKRGSKLLVLTHETIGPRMAGPGIRAWEMACALSERFDVMLAAPGDPGRSHPDLRVMGYQNEGPDYHGLGPCINSADVILTTGSMFVKVPRLQDLEKPAIVDLYDPFELERLAQSTDVGGQDQASIDVENVTHLHLEGAIGDFFICASERQRDFWLGVLLASGRVNSVTYSQDPTLRRLIDVVPFGIPSRPPRKRHSVLKGVHPGIEPQDRILLWNGGLWQWFDPLTLIDALAEIVSDQRNVKLYFAAGRHFNPETVPEMPIYEETVERCRELGLLDRHVFFGEWIPYDEREGYLLEADLGVSAHKPGIESHFASRTRLLDCIWAGLPVVSTSGDLLSAMIAEYELGRVVPPGRSDLLAEAILSMLAKDDLRDRVAANARRIQRELTWESVVEPVSAFLERAAFAPDALTAARTAAETRRTIARVEYLQSRAQQLEQERDKLREHLDEIRQGRVMRMVNAVDGFLSSLRGTG